MMQQWASPSGTLKPNSEQDLFLIQCDELLSSLFPWKFLAWRNRRCSLSVSYTISVHSSEAFGIWSAGSHWSTGVQAPIAKVIPSHPSDVKEIQGGDGFSKTEDECKDNGKAKLGSEYGIGLCDFSQVVGTDTSFAWIFCFLSGDLCCVVALTGLSYRQIRW